MYKIFNYQDVHTFELISKSLMSQIVNFNGIVLGLDTSQNNLNVIYGLITDTNYRNSYILEKTKYLCGIVPIYQRLNKINSGISIDKDNNVVFHDKKIYNYAYRYQDILNYELLEDGIVVLKKKTFEQDHAIKSVKQNCVSISLRVTLISNQIFEISILEPTTFSNAYSHMSSTYIETMNFAKEVIDKLDELNPKPY